MPPILLLVLLSAAPTTTTAVTSTVGEAVIRPAPKPVPSLAQVLAALGEEELRKEARPDCAFRERTRVDELRKDGTVKGSLDRSWAVTRSRSGTETRALLTSERTGDINNLFAKDFKFSEEERRGPFHPETRSNYRFKLVRASADVVEIEFEPIQASEKRLRGRAFVDPTRLVLTGLSVAPSKLPAFTLEVQLDLRFEETACGVQPVNLRMRGAGGFLFFRVGFRSETWHQGHTR